MGSLRQEKLLHFLDVAGQLLGRSAHGTGLSASRLSWMSHLVAIAVYPATCGVQVRCGALQSIPSTNIDSCAGLSVTTPSLVAGHTKRPFSRRLANRQKP